MELSLIYLLLTLIETTCNSFCEASTWESPKLAKWYRLSAVTEGYTETEDGTLYLNIGEDSNSVNELAKKVISMLNLTSDISVQGISLTQVDSSAGRSRRAPGIFGKDTRVNMRASLEAQMYPFSTAVMLSSGCTGTLIGAQHVLTAAHCVRKGKKLLRSAKKLKVGKYLSLTIWHLIEEYFILLSVAMLSCQWCLFSMLFIVICVSRLWTVRNVPYSELEKIRALSLFTLYEFLDDTLAIVCKRFPDWTRYYDMSASSFWYITSTNDHTGC